MHSKRKFVYKISKVSRRKAFHRNALCTSSPKRRDYSSIASSESYVFSSLRRAFYAAFYSVNVNRTSRRAEVTVNGAFVSRVREKRFHLNVTQALQSDLAGNTKAIFKLHNQPVIKIVSRSLPCFISSRALGRQIPSLTHTKLHFCCSIPRSVYFMNCIICSLLELIRQHIHNESRLCLITHLIYRFASYSHFELSLLFI